MDLDVDVIPDLAALSDHELKELIEQKVQEELAVSKRRRNQHAQLDQLRDERDNPLRDRYVE
jgi:hypothetical protein